MIEEKREYSGFNHVFIWLFALVEPGVGELYMGLSRNVKGRMSDWCTLRDSVWLELLIQGME